MLAFLTDPQVVRKILTHLGMETAPPPLAPARVGERALSLWTEEEGSTEWDKSEAYRRESWEAESGDGDTERGPP